MAIPITDPNTIPDRRPIDRVMDWLLEPVVGVVVHSSNATAPSVHESPDESESDPTGPVTEAEST